MNSLEIKDKKEQIKKRMSDIVSNCKKEIRTMTEEEQTQFDDAKSEIEQLNQQLVDLENELQQYQNESDSVDNVEELKNKRKNNTQTQMEFRLIKAINDIANNRQLDESAQEINKRGVESMRKSGQNYGGQILLPIESRSTISATVAGSGIENVAEDKLGILEALRNNLVLSQAGATFMTNLIGNVSIPTYSGSNVAWAGETDSANDGSGSFGEIELAPKRLTAYLDISKQFLNQDSNDAEAMLKNDLVAAISDKLESSIFGSFSGSTTQPAGLFSIVTPVTGVTSYSKVVSLEEGLEGKNYGDKVFVVNPKAKSTFKTTAKATGSGVMVMEGGEMDGYKVLTSNAIVDKGVVFGSFNDYVIGQWGALDITVDPYTVAKDGKIRLVINAYFDAKPRRNDSFATGIA